MTFRQTSPRLAIAAAVNNEHVLQQNLAASPCLREQQVPLHCERQCACAGLAYNKAIDSLDADIIAFVHQDVYLPAGWVDNVLSTLRNISHIDPAWAVAGVVGVDIEGNTLGRSWSNGLGREVRGKDTTVPLRAASLDELVLILRVESRLRFDVSLPGFHLYGTDISQQAMRAQRSVYVIDAPVIHNSTPLLSLDKHFRGAYRAMQTKWRAFLPLPTCIVPISRSPLAMWRQQWRLARKSLCGGRTRQARHDAPWQVATRYRYDSNVATRRAA